MPTVLGVNLSPFVRKARVALAEKGIPYDLVPVFPQAADEEFRKISPIGKVPAFRDGDKGFSDSSVICLYLEKKHPNPPLYPAWQAYFRRHQPPTLIVWGKNDPIFPAEGAHPYTRDLKDVELHLLDTGHFALEEEGDTIARLMRTFLEKRVVAPHDRRTDR